ncbi:SEC-C metal-binding domain-containing protein [Paenibacillus validus]|uniref:SEC-C metal-binding domain-containing protein n=1 Tax=Paenibacillus validus TaxID=44253 RepID=UPI001FD2F9E4|nr:SEC-C metal-binding domain-containing protein [Paenibacillus validus]MED4599175.1 SEC-C metal-binding domain-containing protein [Paenibacillus validus]MED4606518.1 SEC-C metal-binding domain-containing protein [Paenibacillus validus]
MPVTSVKFGKNDPCPCGSGLKHKKCCGKLKEWRVEMQEKSRLLVVDQSYSPIESLENEELYRHGIFEWNISRIIKYIERNEWESIIP